MTKNIQPIDFIEDVMIKRRRVTGVFLSIYRDHPESLIDDRVSYSVPIQNLRSKYQALLQRLKKDEEIAFHSVVTTSGQRLGSKKHIPVIDFRSRDRVRVEQTVQMLLDEYRVQQAALFASGRSFHLYLDALFASDDWVKFMGRLLLLNPRRGVVLTDARWVGHRLMGGYAALRWSANTPPYDQFGPPRLVREWR
jgi:hypothetical protein